MEDGVTERQLLFMCIELAYAKNSDVTDPIEWHRILAGAFGYNNVDRFLALYKDIPLGIDQ
jgi:hypothetical protein